jgi:hypothetical protein
VDKVGAEAIDEKELVAMASKVVSASALDNQDSSFMNSHRLESVHLLTCELRLALILLSLPDMRNNTEFVHISDDELDDFDFADEEDFLGKDTGILPVPVLSPTPYTGSNFVENLPQSSTSSMPGRIEVCVVSS